MCPNPFGSGWRIALAGRCHNVVVGAVVAGGWARQKSPHSDMVFPQCIPGSEEQDRYDYYETQVEPAKVGSQSQGKASRCVEENQRHQEVSILCGPPYYADLVATA